MSESTAITVEALLAAADGTIATQRAQVARLANPLPEEADEGGWTVRQLLSHLVGAWQRVTVHSGHVIGGDGNVPIDIGDAYWIPEWEAAPVSSFALALEAGYVGARAFLAGLDQATLDRVIGTPFGEMPFGQFLMISVSGHPAGMHGPQLEAFVG